MMKHYHIYTAKSGDRFIQTSNKYLAHALVFCGFEFKELKIKDVSCYSFKYSDELLDAIDSVVASRNRYLTDMAKN